MTRGLGEDVTGEQQTLPAEPAEDRRVLHRQSFPGTLPALRPIDDDAERIRLDDVVGEVLHRLGRGHPPADRAGREDLDDRQPATGQLDLERPAQHRLRPTDPLRVGDRAACGVRHAREQREHLGDRDRVAGRRCLTPARARRRPLAEQRRRGHLAAGHAVDAVVDEDDADPLAASRGVDDLGRPDRGEVAVALVGEDERVRTDPADAGRDRRRAAVRGLDEVDRQVVVGEDAAADRGDRDRRGAQMHLVEQLGDEAVDDAVTAAGAVVRRRVGQQRPAVGR